MSDHESVMNSFPGVYICWKDRNSIFRGCNTNFAALFGKRPEDFIGVQDDAAPQIADDKKVLESGESRNNIHESLTVKDGKEIHILTQKGPWKNEKGEIIGIVVNFILDPTKLKEAI